MKGSQKDSLGSNVKGLRCRNKEPGHFANTKEIFKAGVDLRSMFAVAGTVSSECRLEQCRYGWEPV